MTAVSGASNSTGNYQTSFADATYSGVDDAQFMKLLLAQLTNQNPLDPMNDAEFMGQLTQVNMLNELKALNSAIGEFASSTQFTNASNMIGKNIEVLTSDGTATVKCTKVTMGGDSVFVWFGDQSIPLSAVIGVSAEEVTIEED